MHQRSAAFAAILALGILLPACGDDGGGSYTTANVCNSDTGLYIDFLQTALSCQPDLEAFFGSLPDANELSIACDEQFQPYVDDGTVTISQDDADWNTCLDFIANLDCDSFDFDGPNPCENVFIGWQLEGDTCEDSLQCDGDLFCDNSGGTACGTCQPRLANDETCTVSDECTSRLCASDDTCQDFGQVGDPCGDVSDCGGTLECDDTSGLCATPTVWAENDSCDGQNITSQCGFPSSDWYCHPQTNVCTAYLSLGDTCGQGAGFCRILDYESCENGGQNADDTCIAPTIVNEGDACGYVDGLKCADGLFCYDDGNTSTCVTPYAAGDQCTSAGDCPGDFLLSCSDNNVCVYSEYTGTCPAPAM